MIATTATQVAVAAIPVVAAQPAGGRQPGGGTGQFGGGVQRLTGRRRCRSQSPMLPITTPRTPQALIVSRSGRLRLAHSFSSPSG